MTTGNGPQLTGRSVRNHGRQSTASRVRPSKRQGSRSRDIDGVSTTHLKTNEAVTDAIKPSRDAFQRLVDQGRLLPLLALSNGRYLGHLLRNDYHPSLFWFRPLNMLLLSWLGLVQLMLYQPTTASGTVFRLFLSAGAICGMLVLVVWYRPYLPEDQWKQRMKIYLLSTTLVILAVNCLDTVIFVSGSESGSGLRGAAEGLAYVTFVLCMAAFVYLPWVYVRSMMAGARHEQAKLASRRARRGLSVDTQCSAVSDPEAECNHREMAPEPEPEPEPAWRGPDLPPGTYYYILDDHNTSHGPYTSADLFAWIDSASIGPQTMVAAYDPSTYSLGEYLPVLDFYEQLLPELFRVMDPSGSGGISVSRLLRSFRQYGTEALSKDMSRQLAIYHGIDLNSDGMVDAEEFKLALWSVEDPLFLAWLARQLGACLEASGWDEVNSSGICSGAEASMARDEILQGKAVSSVGGLVGPD